MNKKTLLILDGHNIFIRSFSGLMRQDLRSPDGNGTWGVFGAFNTIASMIGKYEPTHVLLAFDHGRSSKRLAIDPDYKANRKRNEEKPKTPKDEAFSLEFKPQLNDFKILCSLNGIPWYSLDNTEADDIIATAALGFHDIFDRVVIVSADHDLHQLVRPNIIVVKPNISYRDIDIEVFDMESVQHEWGVEPWRLPEIWALMGDKGDNVKGIPGIGPKKATKLIAEHKDLDTVLTLEEQRIMDNVDVVRKAYKLIKLDYDPELPFPPLGDLQFNPLRPDGDKEAVHELKSFFKVLGFNQIYERWKNGSLWSFAKNFGRGL